MALSSSAVNNQFIGTGSGSPSHSSPNSPSFVMSGSASVPRAFLHRTTSSLGHFTPDPPDQDAQYGSAYLEWVRSWNDEQIAQWLAANRCSAQEKSFREHDIRGNVLLDVDQTALKEMGVQSVGDRIKIVVAIKALRQRCLAASPGINGMDSGTVSYHTGMRNGHTPSLSEAGSYVSSSSNQTGRSSRPGSRTIRNVPPPLHISQAPVRELPQVYQPHANSTPQLSSHSHSNSAASHSSGGSVSSLLPASVNGQGGANGATKTRHGFPPPPGPPPRLQPPPPPTRDTPSPSNSSGTHHVRNQRSRDNLDVHSSTPSQSPGRPVAAASANSQLGSTPVPSSGSGSSEQGVPGTAGASWATSGDYGLPRAPARGNLGGAAPNRSNSFTRPSRAPVPAVSVSGPNQLQVQSHRKTGSHGSMAFNVQSTQAPSSTTSRPSTASGTSSSSFGYSLSNHPYATSGSPVADSFSLYPTRPMKAANNLLSSPPAGGAGLPPISESLGGVPVTPSSDGPKSASTTASSASSQAGYSVGRGGFARPSTAAGTVSVLTGPSAPSLDDLRRKNVKFIGEDGTSKMVTVADTKDSKEILGRVLKKFGVINSAAGLGLSGGSDRNSSAPIEMEGWGVSVPTSDTQHKLLNDSELLSICHNVHRPERQKGLHLRRVSTEESRRRNVPSTIIELASPIPDVNEMGQFEHPNDRGYLDVEEFSTRAQRRGSARRASMVSVMSSLADWPGGDAPAEAGEVKARPATQSFLSGPKKLRSFFGHRPPSELISNHLADYFPVGAAEKKMLPKTVRNSFRRSVLKRDSQWRASAWNGSNRSSQGSALSPRFSVFSSPEEPPPLPSKDGITRPASDASRLSIDGGLSSPPSILETPAEEEAEAADDASFMSRSTKADRRTSVASRNSMASKLSVRRDSDNSSMLTVDEVTAEIENRRLSRASWAEDGEEGEETGETTVVEEEEKEEAEVDEQDEDDEEDEEEDEDEEDDEDEDEDEDEDDEDDDEKQVEDDEDAVPKAVTSKGAKAAIKWIKGRLIGSGSFGSVYLGMNALNGSLMAVKQVEIPTGNSHNEERKKSMLTALEREIELLKALKHDNIVRYLDSSSDPKYLNIFLEYVPGGSVAGLLKTYGAFEEALVRNFVRQILQGLDYLHEQDIIHRDIKGANILVDNVGVIKISDFGISKKVEDNLLTGPRVHRPSLQGSVYWMAPEVVKQTSYTKKADIWSLGAVMVECLTGEHPWADLSQMQAIFRIGTSATPAVPEDISPDCHDFISQTFLVNHLERPSATELYKHPFIQDGDQQTPTTGDFDVMGTSGNLVAAAA